jgi:polysaccharide deacetylase family protein (PEP-CTERM system associated)
LSGERPRLVLTIDLEDWHQIVHRRLGLADWDRPHEAFERQVAALLALLDELGVRATFFVLGMCAKNYPDAVREIASRGHELGSHGFAHMPVHRQTKEKFRRDVEESIELLEKLGGARPSGYRAPAFSITRGAPWAYDVLADLEFAYDSSQYDTPRIPNRLRGIPVEPYHLVVEGGKRLVEFPVAVGRWRGRRLPVGGGSYWRVLPRRVLFDALHAAAGPDAAPVLYFHPYEFDFAPLRAAGPRTARGTAQALYWNARRGRIAELLRAAAGEFELLSHERYLATAGEPGGTRTKALSPDGALV